MGPAPFAFFYLAAQPARQERDGTEHLFIIEARHRQHRLTIHAVGADGAIKAHGPFGIQALNAIRTGTCLQHLLKLFCFLVASDAVSQQVKGFHHAVDGTKSHFQSVGFGLGVCLLGVKSWNEEGGSKDYFGQVAHHDPLFSKWAGLRFASWLIPMPLRGPALYYRLTSPTDSFRHKACLPGYTWK